MTNSTTHGVGEIWLTCDLFPGFCRTQKAELPVTTRRTPQAQPGPPGGRAAHAVSFAEYSHQEDTVDEQGGTPLTGYVVWRAKTGKVCRRLFITYGFVKQFLNGHVLQKFGDNYIFHPNYYRTSLFHGVGYQPPATTAFKFRVLQFLQSIRRFDQPPVLWHRSSTTQLDKRTEKLYVSSICWIHLGEGFTTICGLDAPPNHLERSLPGMLARRTAWKQYFSSVVLGTVCVKQKFHILHHFLTVLMLFTVWILRVWTRQFKMFHFLPILICYVDVSGGQLYKFMHVMGLLICKKGLEPCRETVWLHNFSWNHITPFWMSFRANYSSWTLRVFWLLMILLQTLMSMYPCPPMLMMLLANFVERRPKSWQIYRFLLINALMLSLLALAWGRTITNKNMSLFCKGWSARSLPSYFL